MGRVSWRSGEKEEGHQRSPLTQMSLALKLGFNTRETTPPEQKSS